MVIDADDARAGLIEFRKPRKKAPDMPATPFSIGSMVFVFYLHDLDTGFVKAQARGAVTAFARRKQNVYLHARFRCIEQEMTESLSFDVHINAPFQDALERTIAALKAEGFGVLTRVDMHEAFKEKLGIDFHQYTILGACNPPLAHRAVSAVPEAGLLLPCNVTVEALSDDGCLVRIVNPREMMQAGGFDADETLAGVGQEAYARLRRVAAALQGD